ncbi:MAG: hypothetical protein AB7F90_11810 [Nitrospirales bacterium]
MDKLTRFKQTNRTLLVIMLGTMTVFGGSLLYFTLEYLESVPELTHPSSQASQDTIHQVGLLMMAVTVLAGMPAVGFGAYVMYLGSQIRVTGQWPPAGMGFQSIAPNMLGDRAGWIGLLVMGLGLVLILTGLGLPIVGWQLGQLLQE